MPQEIIDVTENNFNKIPKPSLRVDCKSCDFWEGGTSMLGPDAHAKELNKRERIKSGAISAKLLCLDGKAIGYCQYGKLSAFSRSQAWRRRLKNPTLDDVFFITCVSIQKEHRGKGLATLLLNNVTNDLRSKGAQIIEALAQKPYSDRFSSGPEKLYLKCGFKIVEELPNLSLMRLVFVQEGK